MRQEPVQAVELEQVRMNDRGAFEAFVRQYQRLVFHVVCRMVPEPADQEDLCQDVFLKVYQNLSRFRQESKVSTWIARIAYNTCLNHLKRKKLRRTDDRYGDPKILEGLPDGGPAPDSQMEAEDGVRRLQIEMERLPVAYRTALTLFHLEEMPLWEIAQVMDLPENTVKSHLFRARRLLKARLDLKYGEGR